MKNAFISALLLFCTTLRSQQGMHIGAEAGPNLSRLYGNSILFEYHSPQMGGIMGLFFQGDVTKWLSVKTGFYYESVQSSALSAVADLSTGRIVAAETRVSFQYLTMPFLLKFTVGREKIKYFINAGGFGGFLLKETETVTRGGGPTPSSTDNTPNFKREQYGISAGIGLCYPASEHFSITVEVRDNLGLNNISNIPVVHEGGIQTNSLNLLLGLAYRLGGS